MRPFAVLVIGLLSSAQLEAKPKYFHVAKLISIERKGADELYEIDSPLGIFTAHYKMAGPFHSPGLSQRGIRISVEKNASVGDSLYFLNSDGKEYKSTIRERRAHPPPPPVP